MQTYRTVLVLLAVVTWSLAGTAVAINRRRRAIPGRDRLEIQPHEAKLRSPQPVPPASRERWWPCLRASRSPIQPSRSIHECFPTAESRRRQTNKDDSSSPTFLRDATGRRLQAGFVNFTHGQRHYGRGGRAIPLRYGEHRDILC